jgi:hypothetical protein
MDASSHLAMGQAGFLDNRETMGRINFAGEGSLSAPARTELSNRNVTQC